MLKLTVVVRARDTFNGKHVVDLVVSICQSAGITGATVTHAARGYGARGVARSDVLGLSVNLPTIIETVAEKEKIAKVLPEVHKMIGSNGLITTQEVSVY